MILAWLSHGDCTGARISVCVPAVGGAFNVRIKAAAAALKFTKRRAIKRSGAGRIALDFLRIRSIRSSDTYNEIKHIVTQSTRAEELANAPSCANDFVHVDIDRATVGANCLLSSRERICRYFNRARRMSVDCPLANGKPRQLSIFDGAIDSR
jgi:hypothetical protein